MRYTLDLSTMATRYRLTQVKAYLKVSADIKSPLHNKLGRDVQSRLKRGKEWMDQAVSTISDCCSVDEIRKGDDCLEFEDKEGKYTSVEETLGRECRELTEGEANDAVEAIIEKMGINGATVVERLGATTIVQY